MNKNELSKYLSYVLRHNPDVVGVDIDEHGWVSVEDLITGIRKYKYPSFSMEILRDIVSTDEKQRYSFSEDGLKIRANQGHSINVDVELERVTPPDVLYHGTATKYEESIDKNGLIPKSRLYVHLSEDISTAFDVGVRHGKKVVLYEIESGKMAADGYEFYLSKNGVWLTKRVPAKYLKKLVIGRRLRDEENISSN